MAEYDLRAELLGVGETPAVRLVELVRDVPLSALAPPVRQAQGAGQHLIF